MRIKSLITILFLILLVLLTDCIKDLDKGKGNIINYLTFEGNTYPLSGGTLVYPEPDSSGVYIFMLDLFTVGIFCDSVNPIPKGAGELIFFHISSNTSSDLQSGTYTIDSTYNHMPGTYIGSYVHNRSNVSIPATIYDLYTGNVTLKKESSNYIIAFNLKTKYGKSIDGYYNGSLIKF